RRPVRRLGRVLGGALADLLAPAAALRRPLQRPRRRHRVGVGAHACGRARPHAGDPDLRGAPMRTPASPKSFNANASRWRRVVAIAMRTPASPKSSNASRSRRVVAIAALVALAGAA